MVEPDLTPPCPNCGKQPEDGARFCYHCGERLREPPPPPRMLPPEPEPKRPRSWPIIVVVLLLIGAGLAGWWLLRTDEAGPAPVPQPTPSESGSATATGSGKPTPEPSLIVNERGNTQLTISVFNCSKCEVIAKPADGAPEQSATVSEGSVQFALPTKSTVGLALEIIHPDGFGTATEPNLVVLRPGSAEPGQPVSVRNIIDAQLVSVCWAGTAAPVSSMALVADPYTDDSGVRRLRAWADPAEATVGTPNSTTGDGLDSQAALLGCQKARASFG